MTVTVEQLENTLKSSFPDSAINVEDVSGGCGAKFTIVIGSDRFEGVALLERHRMANDAIGDLMKEIHAVNFKTWTKKQYEEKTKQ